MLQNIKNFWKFHLSLIKLIHYLILMQQQAKQEAQLVDIPASVISLRQDRMNMVSFTCQINNNQSWNRVERGADQK